MTRKVFWEDPYLTEIETTVASVRGDTVTVSETIFYAFSGGQESDTGSIGDFAVTAARKQGQDILYSLAPDHNLCRGDTVSMKIDWPRRYNLMKLHFAAELVLELVYRQFGCVTKTGAHIAENKARIDFIWDGSIAGALPALSERANAIIDADLPIVSAFSDEVSQRRYWSIDGFAKVPCGGTHLKRTSEVGPINLKRKNPGRNQERIEVSLA